MSLRTDYCGALRSGDAGRTVLVCGWIARRCEHGEHLAFIDVRDHTGVTQCVVDGAHDLRSEYVVKVAGTVAFVGAPSEVKLITSPSTTLAAEPRG